MSTVVGDLNRVRTMPSHMDTPARMFGSTARKTSFRSGLLSQDRERPNENMRNNIDLENMSTGSRTFSFGSRNPLLSSSFSVQNKRLVQESNFVDDQRNVPTMSRAFGLGSRNLSMNSGLSIQNNQELRHNNSRNNVSTISRTFELKSRVPALGGGFLVDNLRLNQNPEVTNFRTIEQESITTESSRFGLGSRTRNISYGVTAQNNGSLNHDLRSVNDSSSMLMSRQFGPQMRNLRLFDDKLKLNRDLNVQAYENNDQMNISSIPRAFEPVTRNTTLSTGLHIQDGIRYNDEIDNEGFKKPSLLRVIRGRNSTMSSRLFSHQNVDTYNKDLSNINGFNVTHISKRGMDSLSESRLALNTRQNGFDNQSINGSVLSTASMKAQFMNLLENLHHSILNIGPHMTAEAVRMEFDKARQGLENISEMSYAPSIRETDAASVISHSSKYNCIQMPERSVMSVLDVGSIHLKRGKDLLKNLLANKESKRISDDEEENRSPIKLRSHTSLTDDHDSALTFMKPKPYSKKKRISSKMMKIKTPKVSKSLSTKVMSKGINLKQWYPIAVGSDLAICGVDEEGADVKTDPVKKRVSNRKLELINGLNCNLIGSPSSSMVSLLPKKIMNLLKNGLTERWRVLQKELLSCQTAEEEAKKRRSKSPVKGKKRNLKSPTKATTVVKETKKRQSKSPVKTSPKKKEKVSGMHTRSGRTVKPPTSFWILRAKEGEEVSSSDVTTSKGTPRKTKKAKIGTPEKKTKRGNVASPRKIKETPIQGKRNASRKRMKSLSGESPSKKTKSDESSPKKLKKASSTSSKVTSQKKVLEESKTMEEMEEVVEVHSSTEDSKKREYTRKSPAKRKRKAVAADSEATQRKKSKLDQKMEAEVESTVEVTQGQTKGKRKKSRVIVSVRSPKPKLKKSSQVKKGKGTTQKNSIIDAETENATESRVVNEFEEDYELQLDDIEIPELANVSGNPRLTRSQMRVVSMETPPLKYFNSNLKIMSNATPTRSPDWFISQRTESEVKQFQRRREEAFRKRIKMTEVKKTIKETSNNPPQSRDMKLVLDWVAKKTVKSPQWTSKVLQYVIPSRKQLEQEDDEAEEDMESEFL